MEHALDPSQILDLTSHQTLFELSIDDHELLGASGAKLIADLKEKASEADYTHIYFRDPIRPGIVWYSQLGSDAAELDLPTRTRLDDSRAVTERVFPQFLESLRGCDDQVIEEQIPPLAFGVSGLDLVTALEYLVYIYPEMVRAWAALIFTYDQMMGLKEGAESSRESCLGICDHAQVVAYLLEGPASAAS